LEWVLVLVTYAVDSDENLEEFFRCDGNFLLITSHEPAFVVSEVPAASGCLFIPFLKA
jgi:hypothetical protein